MINYVVAKFLLLILPPTQPRDFVSLSTFSSWCCCNRRCVITDYRRRLFCATTANYSFHCKFNIKLSLRGASRHFLLLHHPTAKQQKWQSRRTTKFITLLHTEMRIHIHFAVEVGEEVEMQLLTVSCDLKPKLIWIMTEKVPSQQINGELDGHLQFSWIQDTPLPL